MGASVVAQNHTIPYKRGIDMTMKKYADLGSVSSGTMRPCDLIPEFLNVLEYLDWDRYASLLTEYPSVDDEEFDYNSEDADWLLAELFDALDEYAPPYCYFGAHEGDCSDYGFWPSWDAIADDRRYGPILAVSAGDDWPNPLPDGTEYVLEVTDHGNGTLYTLDHIELWSVV